MKNNNGSGRKKTGKRKGKFEPDVRYVIIKLATKPATIFGSQALSQERIMFRPSSQDDAVKYFQEVIASTQPNPDMAKKMRDLSPYDFMKEFSDSFNGTFVPFHSTNSFVEKMIELEIFRKAELQ